MPPPGRTYTQCMNRPIRALRLMTSRANTCNPRCSITVLGVLAFVIKQQRSVPWGRSDQPLLAAPWISASIHAVLAVFDLGTWKDQVESAIELASSSLCKSILLCPPPTLRTRLAQQRFEQTVPAWRRAQSATSAESQAAPKQVWSTARMDHSLIGPCHCMDLWCPSKTSQRKGFRRRFGASLQRPTCPEIQRATSAKWTQFTHLRLAWVLTRQLSATWQLCDQLICPLITKCRCHDQVLKQRPHQRGPVTCRTHPSALQLHPCGMYRVHLPRHHFLQWAHQRQSGPTYTPAWGCTVTVWGPLMLRRPHRTQLQLHQARLSNCMPGHQQQSAARGPRPLD